MSMETVDALFTPMLRYPKDKNTLETDFSRAPTFKIKLPCWEGVWKNIDLYDPDRRLIFPVAQNPSLAPGDFIQKGSQVAVGVQCGGIWFAGGKFGVTWNLVQAIVKPKMSFRGTCGIDLGGDAQPQHAQQQTLNFQKQSQQQQQQQQHEQSDEDDYEQDDSVLSRTASSAAPVHVQPVQQQQVQQSEEPITKKKIVRKLPAATA
jgi:hypothetical protein